MIEIFNIIIATPYYVWLILLYLLYTGIKSLKDKTVSLPRLFILPLVMLAIKYKTFISPHFPILIFSIISCATISFYVHAGDKIKINKNSRQIIIPGNYSTIIILFCYFITRYFFGYMKAIYASSTFDCDLLETVVSGSFTGCVAGKTLRYAYTYLKLCAGKNI